MKATSRFLPAVLVLSLLFGATLACGRGGKNTRVPEATTPPADVAQEPTKRPAPSIVTFLADDPLVPAGGCTVLRWEVQGAEAVYVNRRPVAGNTQEICPASTASYLLAATNAAGTSRARVVVEVGDAPAAGPLPEIVSFDADEPGIAAGECTTLRWDVRGATAVAVVGEQATGTSVQVCPAVTTAYTLIAESAAGPVSATTTVEVGEPAAAQEVPWIVSFDADAPRVEPGECTALRWDVRGATAATLDGEPVAGPSAKVCPKRTTLYRLEARNASGAAQAHARVEVGGETGATPVQIVSFDADEPAITAGQCTTLRWDVRGAAQVLIDRQPVTGTSLEVCPPASAGYRLTALDEQDHGLEASARVTVNDSAGREVADTITGFAVQSEGIRSLAFTVEVRYVSFAEHGAQVSLVAVPVLSKQAIEGAAADPQPVRPGSGQARFRMSYSGADSATSDQIVVYMLDPETQLPIALASFDFDKTWAAADEERPDYITARSYTSPTPGEYEVTVGYRYVSDHGDGVRIGGTVTGLEQDVDPSRFRVYASDVLERGDGMVTLRVRYTGARETSTRGIRLYMWEPEAPRFYVQSFELALDWLPPLRDQIAVDGTPEQRSGREMAIPIRYRYLSDHGQGVGIRIAAFDGEAELDDFVCVECPTNLAPSEEERRATLVIRYVGPGTQRTTRVSVYFWEPEVPRFHQRGFEREWTWGGPLTVRGVVQPYGDGTDAKCTDPDYTAPWPVTLRETYPYDPPRTWTLNFATRSDCDGARAGQTKQWTGLLSKVRAGLVEQSVPGEEWHKSLVGTVTFRTPAEKSVEIITPTYWEDRDEANQVFTVFFANAADFDRVGINDFISVDGKPGGQWKLRQATLDWTSPRRRTLDPLPTADSSLTEATGFDLIVQVSRELLQSVLSDEFEPIEVPWVTPDGVSQKLVIEEPTLDLNGAYEYSVLLLLPVHSEDGSLQFTMTMGASFMPSGLSSELKVLFTSPAIHSVRYRNRIYREQDLDPALQAAVDAAGALLSRVPIALPLDFVDDLIADIPSAYDVSPTPREWVPLVVPTDASGDGWVFLGANVANPFDPDWWWDVTAGDWRYVFDLTGGATGDGAAFAVSDELVNTLIAVVEPPEPFAITFEELGIEPVVGSDEEWLGVEGYSLKVEVASWNIRMIIVDDLPLEYAGGTLTAPFARIDLYAIDVAEVHCWDNSEYNHVPTPDDVGEPGDRAYSHGLVASNITGRLTMVQGADGPALALANPAIGVWIDRSERDILMYAADTIDSFVYDYLGSYPPAILDLRFPLPGSLGSLEALTFETRPREVVMAFRVVP